VDELNSSSPCPSPDLHPTDNKLSHPPSPVKIVAPVKVGLHSYFPTVHMAKRSLHNSDQPEPSQPSPKRVRVQPSPAIVLSSSKSKEARTLPPPSNSWRSAANKQALNEAVEAGRFRHDERKWATFKSKIMAIDPQSEVDDVNPRCARDVLHMKCGKSIRMAMVYNISLYKRHVQRCKSLTAMAGMHTLDNGLNFVFFQKSGSPSLANGSVRAESTLWPCPGLSEGDDPRIETYLLRTTVSSAGGVSIEAVAAQMYNTLYKNLTDADKRAARAGQVHTHRWSLDHQRRRVFAIGEDPCLRKVLHSSGQPLACRACKALLGDRAFRTAINRDIPDDFNRKFTPLLYQAAEIAKICAKHSGLGAIFDKVK
jgi:hypothetical protein